MPTKSMKLSELYRGPFTYDGISYIWDANREMVADFRSADKSIRPRGWGRFQYMPNGSRIHDAVESLIIQTCKGMTRPEDCVVALNDLLAANTVLEMPAD